MILIKEEFTQKQQIVLTIYAILSLPLLPLMVVLYPFSKWLTRSDNDKEELKLSMLEFLSLSMAMSVILYFIIGMAYCCPPTHR